MKWILGREEHRDTLGCSLRQGVGYHAVYDTGWQLGFSTVLQRNPSYASPKRLASCLGVMGKRSGAHRRDGQSSCQGKLKHHMGPGSKITSLELSGLPKLFPWGWLHIDIKTLVYMSVSAFWGLVWDASYKMYIKTGYPLKWNTLV